MAGFFKVPHELYRALVRDSNTFRVYCELASRARWSAGSCLGSHGIVDLAVGQCVLGRGELATSIRITEANVRTAINRLVKLGAITVESTKLGTIATIRNYDETPDVTPTNQPSDGRSPNQAAPSPINQEVANNEQEKKKQGQKKDRKAARTWRVVPADWQPRAEDQLLSPPQLQHELANFRDHEFRTPKTDADATWRTWQRNTMKFADGRRDSRAIGPAQPASHYPDSGVRDFG